jgi:curved DNA-binding protein CbpA
MYIEILGLDINNISKYTKEDIKRIYKKIALECHPDKLIKIQDIKVKNAKIERFKKACIAYKKAIEDFDNYGELRAYPNRADNNNGNYDDYGYSDFGDFGDFGDYSNPYINFWEDMYSNYFNDKKKVKNTFINLANIFLTKGLSKGFNRKNYYNPSSKVIKHSIILPVNYLDLHNDKNKKIRILLKGVKKPFNFSILCKKEYPHFKRQYIDDDGIEHEIEIKMMISNANPTKIFNKKSYSCSDSPSNSSTDSATDSSTDSSDDSSDSYEGLDYDKNRLNNKNIEYRHKIVNDRIDLMIDIFINLKDYLEGSCKTIKYIDNNYIKIDIPPFTLNNVIFNNKGLLGGNLVVNVILLNISKINWDKLGTDDKKQFIKTIENIYKN